MPAKRNTNKLSQLYKTIDQKGLSQDAKETLKKLRLATANFNKKEGKEADAFNLFYNRLLAKKPTAIKTTKEYKEMVLEKKREVARKMMEAKKAKQESRQGQGSERDASRPAKPFGWRLKGKHNYRKPTRADISTGKAYYEARINRADTKRTKFPMLERGGYMAKGGITEQRVSLLFNKLQENGKLVRYIDTRGNGKKYFETIIENPAENGYWKRYESTTRGSLGVLQNEFLDKNDVKNWLRKTLPELEEDDKMAHGGYMAEGGEIDNQNNLNGLTISFPYGRENVYTVKRIIENYVDDNYQDYGDDIYVRVMDGENGEVTEYDLKKIAKDIRNLNSGVIVETYERGGYMAEGGQLRSYKTFVEEYPDKKIYVRVRFAGADKDVQNYTANEANKERAISFAKRLAEKNNGTYEGFKIYTYAKGGYMAKGGEIKNQYEGRTPEDIWNSYSKDQRLHFLYDHAEEINEYKAIESEDEKPWFNAAYKSNWDDLDMDVKNRFANHVRGGQYADGGEVDKGGMIYALRNEISSGTIANKSGVDTYQEVAQVRRDAIDYYLKNGDVPYSLGELDRVLSMSNKMTNEDGVKNRRTLKFSDAVLYKGDMYTFVKRDGDVGFVSNSQGAWGMSGSFLPLRNLLRSDLEENLTDMYGNKFYIPPYDELIKMPYGFAKGGSMDNGGVFYTESHKLGHE